MVLWANNVHEMQTVTTVHTLEASLFVPCDKFLRAHVCVCMCGDNILLSNDRKFSSRTL